MSSATPTSARRPPRMVFRDPEAATPRTASARNESARRQRRASESATFSPTPGAISRGGGSRLGGLQTQGNAMKVYVRVRPYSERELAQTDKATHSTVRIDAENPSHITLLDPARNFDPLATYPFSRCFWSVFVRTADNRKANQTMAGMRDTVDTYLNGGMNSGRRSRAASFSGRLAGKEESAPAYQGSGSGAVVVDANVSHPPYASQADVYQYVGRPILENTIEGYNGCIFAYGQTGSGKTFTMMGYAPTASELRRANRQASKRDALESSASMSMMEGTDSPDVAPLDIDNGADVVNKAGLDPIELQGITPRICVDLFQGLRQKRKENDSLSYRVEVSYYEIYNEKVFDLIKPSKTELKVGNNPISGPYVDGLASKVCVKEDDVLKVIRKGMQERHTAQTKFNDRSSRSHAILVFNIIQIYLDSVGSTTKLESKLNLVDLAGSERAGAAGADRPEYREGVNINLSLTVLGRVIDCLADLSKNRSLAVPVPYRDSRLTMLLMDSIGGNSQTSMVATISPHMINFEEMKQTLRYASRAKQIINRAVRNEDPQVVYIRELKSEVERLQQLLKEAGGHEFTRDYVLELEERVRQLERRCAEQETTIASLRAELESAGISDPTRESRRSSANGGEPRSGAAYLQASESLQLQLDTANREIAKLQKELLARAGQSGSAKVQKEQEEKIVALGRQLDAMRDEVHDRDALLRNFATFQLPWMTEVACSAFESKGLAVLRECRSVLAAKGMMIEEAMNKGHVSGLVALNEQQKRHDEELAERDAQQRQELAELEKLYETRDQERERRHREALASVEAKLRDSIATYDQEKRRMAQERDGMRLYYEDALTRQKMASEEEMQKLRVAGAAAPVEGRSKNSDAVRSVTDSYEAKLRETRAKMEAAQAEHDLALASMRSQISVDAAKKEAELNEKDRQRREVERQLSTLRQENLTIIANARRADKEKQDQVKDLVTQQENLVALVTSAVAAWQSESAGALDSNMATLQALVAEGGDMSTLRQRAKDLAYRGIGDHAGRGGRSGRASGQAKMPGDAKEREFKEMLEKMKQKKAEREANMHRLTKECYEQQTRIRGMQGGSGSDEQDRQNSTPPETNRP